MQTYAWDQVEKEQLNPLLTRQVIHSETMTVARIFVKKGGVVPEHRHHNEQISMVQQGSMKFVLAGEAKVLRPGDILRIPPHAPHSVEAMEDCIVVDLFSPPREDWKSGDDSYLRK